jgi:hypothetical protein
VVGPLFSNQAHRVASSSPSKIWSLICLLVFLIAPAAARADLVINEILASNRSGLLDDDGDASDWVELYNSGSETINLLDYGLSDSPNLPGKWQFPEVRIDPGGYLLVWCSGKNRILPSSGMIVRPDSPLDFTANLVSLRDAWRFLTGAPDDGAPPENWSRLEFDDSSWQLGKPGFGFGDGDDATLLPEGIGAVFLRRVFTVESVDALSNLVLQVAFDDGFVAYLNGVRVQSVNFSEAQEPTFSSHANRSVEAALPVRFDLSQHLGVLQPGPNVLAMVLLNLSPTSVDLSLIPELGTVPPSLHSNFKLERSSESVTLSDPSGALVDRLSFPVQSEDHSYGRFPDGTRDLYYMLFTSPLKANDPRISTRPISSEIRWSHPSGIYGEPLQVQASADVPFDGFQIRYTTDGSLPTAASPIYEGPLELASGRNHVLQAIGLFQGVAVTRVATRNYLMEPRAQGLSLPILSFTLDPIDFQTVHLSRDGRGMEFEKPAYMEIFDAEGRLDLGTGFGLRLHGGAGRGGDFNVKKAYRAHFRGRYGAKKLNYRIFADTPIEEFDTLVLRSNFNDAFRTGSEAAYIRDQAIRDLHRDMGATISHGSWYNLYVNGQYRGLYNVVERMDKDFFASYFPEDGENWDVIKTSNDVLEGTVTEWNQLRSFMERNNLGDPHSYREAVRRLDLHNFTDYMILNIWAQNHDWPHNNWYAARPRRDDSRWMFLSWDAEFGLGRIPSGFSADTFEHVFERNGTNLSVILSSLMRSSEYQKHFLAELAAQLAGPLSPANVLAHIDRLRRTVEDDMDEEAALAGYSLPVWLNNIRAMEAFAAKRGPYIEEYVLHSRRFTFSRITSVEPRQALLLDDAPVTVRGLYFTPQSTVSFRKDGPDGVIDLPSPRVEFISSSELRAGLPFDGRLLGLVDVVVLDPINGTAAVDGAIELLAPKPRLRGLSPSQGSDAGGDWVTILGENFTSSVRVEFGPTASPRIQPGEPPSQVLRAETPPGLGNVRVRVVNVLPAEIAADESFEFYYIRSARFRRGDATSDGVSNITDVVSLLRYLFSQRLDPRCLDAMDVDDSGRVDITDAVLLLDFLFRSPAATIAEPSAGCGLDLTEDSLTCDGPTACSDPR